MSPEDFVVKELRECHKTGRFSLVMSDLQRNSPFAASKVTDAVLKLVKDKKVGYVMPYLFSKPVMDNSLSLISLCGGVRERKQIGRLSEGFISEHHVLKVDINASDRKAVLADVVKAIQLKSNCLVISSADEIKSYCSTVGLTYIEPLKVFDTFARKAVVEDALTNKIIILPDVYDVSIILVKVILSVLKPDKLVVLTDGNVHCASRFGGSLYDLLEYMQIPTATPWHEYFDEGVNSYNDNANASNVDELMAAFNFLEVQPESSLAENIELVFKQLDPSTDIQDVLFVTMAELGDYSYQHINSILAFMAQTHGRETVRVRDNIFWVQGQYTYQKDMVNFFQQNVLTLNSIDKEARVLFLTDNAGAELALPFDDADKLRSYNVQLLDELNRNDKSHIVIFNGQSSCEVLNRRSIYTMLELSKSQPIVHGAKYLLANIMKKPISANRLEALDRIITERV